MDNFPEILKALAENPPARFRDGFQAGLITGLSFLCTPEEIEELQFQTSYADPSSVTFIEWLTKVRERMSAEPKEFGL